MNVTWIENNTIPRLLTAKISIIDTRHSFVLSVLSTLAVRSTHFPIPQEPTTIHHLIRAQLWNSNALQIITPLIIPHVLNLLRLPSGEEACGLLILVEHQKFSVRYALWSAICRKAQGFRHVHAGRTCSPCMRNTRRNSHEAVGRNDVELPFKFDEGNAAGYENALEYEPLRS